MDRNLAMPASTANLLQTLAGGGQHVDLPPDRATAITRALLTANLNPFHHTTGWPEAEAQEKNVIDMARTTVELLSKGFERKPGTLAYRGKEEPELSGLLDRARKGNGVGEGGAVVAEADKEEELAVWLVPRLLHVAAVLRSTPVKAVSVERLERRWELAKKVEEMLCQDIRLVLTSKDLREGREGRRKELGVALKLVEEDARGWLEAGPVVDEQGKSVVGRVKIYGQERRTQYTDDEASELKIDRRPFILPLPSRSYARALLLSTVKIHLASLPFAPHLIDTTAAAIQVVATLWEWAFTPSTQASDSDAPEEAARVSFRKSLVEIVGKCLMMCPEDIAQGARERLASLVIEELDHYFTRRGKIIVDEPVSGPDCDVAPLLITIRRLVDQYPAWGEGSVIRALTSAVVRHADALLFELSIEDDDIVSLATPFGTPQIVALVLLTFPRLPVEEGRAVWGKRIPPLLYRIGPATSVEGFEQLLLASGKPGISEEKCAVFGEDEASLTSLENLMTSLWDDARTFLLLQPVQEGGPIPQLTVSQAPAKKRKRGSGVHTAPVPSSDGGMSMDVDRGGGAGTQRPPQRRTRTYGGTASTQGWRATVHRVVKGLSEEGADVEDWKLVGVESVIAARINGLVNIDASRFVGEADQIGMLACARGGTLQFEEDTPVPHDGAGFCTICDEIQRLPSPTESGWLAARSLGLSPLQALRVVAPKLLGPIPEGDRDAIMASRAQLAFLRLVGRVLAHAKAATASLDFSGDPLAVCVLKTMEAAGRMQRVGANRVAAGVLAAYSAQGFGGGIPPSVVPLINTYQSLAARRPVKKVLETTIVGMVGAFGMAPFSTASELCKVIVAQLGHNMAYFSGITAAEVTSLAARRDTTVYKLLAPHLPAVSPIVVAQSRSFPNMIRRLSDMLLMSPETMIVATAVDSLPPLVLRGQADLITDVANAFGTDVPSLLINQAASILAHLFLKPQYETKAGLNNLAQFVRGVDITTKKLVEASKEGLLYDIIVEMGDEEPTRCQEAKEALRKVYIASNSSSGNQQVLDEDLGRLLEGVMVPILSLVNGAVLSPRGGDAARKQNKNIRGLGALVELAGPSVRAFTPQIMATLQTSLRFPDLRDSTLATWGKFVNVSKFKDLGPFIGQISAAFVACWDDMTEGQRNATASIIDYLVRNIESVGEYKWHLADIQSLSASTLDSARAIVLTLQKKQKPEDRFRVLVDRTESENNIVAAQALRELRTFLISGAGQLKSLLAGDVFDPIIGKLLKALLSAGMRGGEASEVVRSLAFQCLGCVGAVDPDRCEIPADPPTMVLAHNFVDHDEAIDFAIHLVQDELVTAFRSTNDTKHQQHLAYTIQELLTFCGFDEHVLTVGNANKVAQKTRRRWDLLPKSVLDAITPLLGGKFRLTIKVDRSTPGPVFYRNTKTFNAWITAWVEYLIGQANGKDAVTIFGACLGAVRNADAAVAQKLLPHLALNVMLAGSEDQVASVRQEINAILEDQVNRASGFSPEGRQLAAQTGRFRPVGSLQQVDKGSAEGTHTPGKWKKPQSRAPSIARIESAMSQVSQGLMAHAALFCKAHARAVLNFEQRIIALEAEPKFSEKDLQSYYEYLHEIYAAIDEPDGMEGISTKIVSPSILHQIREHESTGRWTSAQSCWEVELQQRPDDLRSHVGLLTCLRNLGHYDSLRTHILGVLQTHPGWESELAPFAVESSLVASDWSALRRATEVGLRESPEVIFGKVVDTIRSNAKPEIVALAMEEARMNLGNQILGAGKNTYQRIYDSAIYLHILHEVDLINNGSFADQGGLSLQETLDVRFQALSPVFRCTEQVLRLRRAAFQLKWRQADDAKADVTANAVIGPLWVDTAKIARKAGHVQTAYSAVLQAAQLDAPLACLQRAKLLKLEDQPYKAIAELEHALNALRPELAKESDERIVGLSVMDFAKASLRWVRWMQEVDRYDPSFVIKEYDKTIRLCEGWESPYYYVGRFHDERANMLSSKADNARITVEIASYQYHCVRNFSHALANGTKFIFQTLPRMLTIFFEMGEHPDITALTKALKKKQGDELDCTNLQQALEKIETGCFFNRTNKVLMSCVRKLPAFVWLTVLPQVVSRVTHKNILVQETVQKLLIRVLIAYPDQALWAMVSGLQSSEKGRAKRCKWAVDDADQKASTYEPAAWSKAMHQKILDATNLVPQLLHLCNFPVGDHKTRLSMQKHFPKLMAVTPCDLVIPLQSSLTGSLPARDVSLSKHQPFPPRLPTIQTFGEVIEIMSSLQKPRKIVVIGSDGKEYPFLCKPKDDLRKDARLMEFNSMINKLLKKDSDSRKRNLHIRTYAVVVLNEECGLLEWVNNTVGLRHILAKAYSGRGIQVWNNALKQVYDTIKAQPQNTGNIFKNQILPKCVPTVEPRNADWVTFFFGQVSPIFHEWFLNNFPEPNSWLRGRMAYGRTAAVMSMVGFVLGLGDRHGENILFDSTTGDTVHVDFNCLFDKGRTFEVAEKVPFRLTHNLVDGLGVTGVEGVFRKASEVTMKILRLNKDSLMSVLETFVHDPLVDWLPVPNKKRTATTGPTEDHINREARRSLDPIARKLKGLQITLAPSGKIDRETSAENQVESLLKEATDPKNLGGMYVGWSPYL